MSARPKTTPRPRREPVQPTTFAEAMALLEATERLARSRGAQLRALSSGTKVAPESRAAEVAALAEIWRLRGCP